MDHDYLVQYLVAEPGRITVRIGPDETAVDRLVGGGAVHRTPAPPEDVPLWLWVPFFRVPCGWWFDIELQDGARLQALTGLLDAVTFVTA